MKVLFCFYPLFVKYNHGIALLSKLCKDAGIQTDLYILDDVDRFGSYIDGSFDVICFSIVSSMEYTKSIPFLKKARSVHRGKIYLGGPWAQLQRPVEYVDGVCRCEGETLPDFLLGGPDTLFGSSTVCYDLNELPLPDYDMFENIPFDRGIKQLDGKKCLPYYSSRGCLHRCSFCQVRYQPRYRVRTRAFEDLTYLTDKYSPDVLVIGDAQLPYVSTEWRDSWGNFRYPFVAYIRADIDREILLWLIDRGMEGCAFGIESGDEKYRNDVLRKDLTDDQVWRTIDLLRDNGVWFSAFFMQGTPGETFKIRKKTFDMIDLIGDNMTIVWSYEEL